MRTRVLSVFLLAILSWGSLSAEDYTEMQAKGAQLLHAFRNFRYKGDYALEFDLEHMPRRGVGHVYRGRLWGTWNREGALTRIELWPAAGRQGKRIHLLIQNGRNPRIWRHATGDKEPTLLPAADMFKPLFTEAVYTPFDLLMGYIYWDNYNYNGDGKAMGRKAHEYYMYAPKSLRTAYPDLGGMNLSVDTEYNAILKAVYMTPLGQPFKSMKVLRFKKVQGEYIINRIDMVDELTHNKTRFEVVGAAMGQKFAKEVFSQESLTGRARWIANTRIRHIRRQT